MVLAPFGTLAAVLPTLEGDAPEAAVRALPHFDSCRTIPRFRRLVRHPTPPIRTYALVAPDMIGGAGTVAVFPRSLREDPAPEVRFRTAFVLGKMRSPAVLPRLREMAEHHTVLCPLWWTVAKEASDAIHRILTGAWPNRDRGPDRPSLSTPEWSTSGGRWSWPKRRRRQGG